MANDYKDTMNLPQTNFAMRAGLPQNEPKRLQKWEQDGLYERMLEHNEGNPSYILHDGPPYANGPIHIGHAFNKILKDFIVKYKTLRGFYSPYVPGWDCHGQPIEHMVEAKLGPEKMAKIDQVTLRRLCREWATKNIDIQRDGFKRLGVLGKWNDPYLTYIPAYEAGNVKIFKEMYEQGSIYRGRKPIHWCKHCHTALAEAEIEYADEVSPSIYVDFRLTAPALAALQQRAHLALSSIKELGILIWTTTPWTLPANVAVSVAPNADYVIAHNPVTNKQFIVAQELVGAVSEVAGWSDGAELLKTADGDPVCFRGIELAGLEYLHPIHADMLGKIVVGEHVELTTGTGAVHTAPGHGQEDYLVGVEYELPLLMPVDDNGVFDSGAGPFEGLDVEEANPQIIEWLGERGSLLAAVDITHSYPHCWRCHNPVIFRATDQWFVSMESNGLRTNALAEIEKLKWYPDWASKRLNAMIENRPDWCISRQRSWGVPIPVFKCAKCSSTIATPETFDAVIELFEREGADAWFAREPKEYLPTDTACPTCGSHEILPEKDILDVWWESGVSHTSVLEVYPELSRPADLYLEGSDQHRGWFQSSLLTSVGAYAQAPYLGIMSCGFTVDENGEKMSKSKGNGVDPKDVIEKFGADVLRLWVASVDSATDVRISADILDRSADAYRRFRNTYRFLLSNLYDFDAANDIVSYDELTEIDRWAFARLQKLVRGVEESYDVFRWHQAYHLLYDYVVTDLSAVYLDGLKDRLYSDAAKSVARRSAQTVLLNVLEALVRLLAPVLTFTTDEVLENYPDGLRYAEFPGAVMLAGWPEQQDFKPSAPAGELERVLDDFEPVLAVREVVTKALEEARGAKTIGKSQEAHVVLKAPQAIVDALDEFSPQTLAELLIVAEVSYEAAASGDGEPIMAAISVAAGEKCPRCWNVRELGQVSSHSDVCERCAHVLEAL